MRIAFRIEVNTVSAANEVVPVLLKMLDEYKARGNFFLSLGHDHSDGQLARMLPSSWLNHLPATQIGIKARDNLQAIKSAGHEVGLSAFTPSAWRSDVAYQSKSWISDEVYKAVEAFESLYQQRPTCYGASGWQVNQHLFAMEQALRFDFASDVRGRGPFRPSLQETSGGCPQIPTTLPTLTEMLSAKDITHDNIHQYIYAECQRILPNGEVFNLDAGSEGSELLAIFERLLVMWKGGQWEFKTLSELLAQCQLNSLPRHHVGWGEVPGGRGHVAMQSEAVTGGPD